jgi:TRAP-type uncharacterized transport system substrate-binding protein
MARTTLRFASVSTRLTAAGLVAFGLLAFGCASDDPEPDPNPQPTPAAQTSVMAELAGAEAREAVLDGRAVILAGGPGGAYYELARTLKVSGDDRAPALVGSAGSLETLHLLAWGQGDVGMVQADVLQDPRQRGVRAALADTATPLFDEEVHVLVAPEGASDLLALAGKKVGIGGAGSGSATTAENLFRAAGVYDIELVPGAFSDHAAALKGGELAAIVAVGAQPLASLHEAGLKVLDMGDARDEVLAELQKINPSYRAGEVSEESGGPAKTVAIPAVLVRRAGFTGELDFGGASDSAHPAGKSVAGGSEALPASLDGPSLTIRDPEASIRFAAPAEGDLGSAGKAVMTAWSKSGQNVQGVTADGAGALALLSSGQAEAAIVSMDALHEALARPETARLLAKIQVLSPLFARPLHMARKGGNEAAGHVILGQAGSSKSISTRRFARLGRDRLVGMKWTGYTTREAGFEVLEGATSEHETVVSAGLKGYTDGEDGQGNLTQAVLVTRRGLQDGKAQALVNALFANRKNLAGIDARFESLDPASLSSLPEGIKAHSGVDASAIEADSAEAWGE